MSRDIIQKDHIYHTKQYQTFYRKIKCDLSNFRGVKNGYHQDFHYWWFLLVFYIKWQCWYKVLCLINFNHENFFFWFFWCKDLTIPLRQFCLCNTLPAHIKKIQISLGKSLGNSRVWRRNSKAVMWSVVVTGVT